MLAPPRAELDHLIAHVGQRPGDRFDLRPRNHLEWVAPDAVASEPEPVGCADDPPVIDLARKRITRDDDEVGLTPTEWAFLYLLARLRGPLAASYAGTGVDLHSALIQGPIRGGTANSPHL